MYMIKEVMQSKLRRSLQTVANAKRAMGNKFVMEPLQQRELMRVQGEGVVPFLQSLMTNDMSHLEAKRTAFGSMYAMFLNNAGRVIYDSIIYRTPKHDTYLIECDDCVSKELRRHLRQYRVRRRIEIDSMKDDLCLWALFSPDEAAGPQGTTWDAAKRLQSEEICIIPDPRIRELGVRILTSPSTTWDELTVIGATKDLKIMPASKDCNYRLHRYRYGIGEGVLDILPGKSFPLETNCDFLHGVSFHKGCYIGQEVTARIHHTGVVRKRLMPVQLSAVVAEPNAIIKSEAGVNLGTLRGSENDRALALMRVEAALNAKQLLLNGNACSVEKPKWWPIDMSKRSVLSEAS